MRCKKLRINVHSNIITKAICLTVFISNTFANETINFALVEFLLHI